jgi:hypothetical protein
LKRTILASILAFLCLAAAAPGGPGDSEPIGTGPYSLIHAPGSVTHGTTYVAVWVHCQNMGGYALTLFNNSTAATVKIHSANQPFSQYPGTWDDYNDVDISGLHLGAGSHCNWYASVMDTDDYGEYDSALTTNIN